MDWGILFLLFFAAWGLRVIGLDWGYLHGDERVNQAAKVLAGQLIPDQHFYPPLMHYMAAVMYGGLYAGGRGFDLWSNSGEFRAQYFEDPTIFYLTARAMTGAISALLAPLFYRIGRLLGFGKGESFVIALFAVFAPLSIYLSYIFKGDVGIAVASVWIVLLMIRKVQCPSLKRIDIFLGVAVVFGLSFKHSFVLLMVPFALAYIVVMSGHIGFKATMGSILRIFLTAVILWPPMNIGIILDFDNFLKFQEIQSVMSIAENVRFVDAVGKMLRAAMDWEIGISLLMPYAFLLFPVFAMGMERPGMLLAVWVATIVSTLGLAYLVGLRQPEQLWIAHFMVVQLFGAISIACIYRLSKLVGSLAAVAALGFCVVGDIMIWKQAIVRPLNVDVASYLKTVYPDRKVMTSIDLPLQQNRAAQDFEWARVTRTAEKYNLVMPEIAGERRIPENLVDAYFVVPMPEVMFGLEGTTDADLEGSIAPFAWPPQPEDWKLENWRADGVDLFVISDLEGWLGKDNAPVMQAFFQEVETECQSVQAFVSRKPLFLERDTVVLDCRGSQ
jgi:hypothetical protein